MVKIRGPLLSLAASGTYDQLITFRTRGISNSAMKQHRSSTPRSQNQQSHTARVNQMRASWATETPASRTAWAACAAPMNLSGFNLYWREWFIQNPTPPARPVNPC